MNKLGVESDRGFSVQSIGRSTIEYREGDKKISVGVEDGMRGGTHPCVIIEPTAFERWDGDPPYVVLPGDKQQEMLSNFIEAMEFQGVLVDIERRFT